MRACNARVRRGRFWFHYSLLALIAVAIASAGVLSFAFHSLNVKGFREEFSGSTVVSQSIAMFNFFICQCVWRVGDGGGAAAKSRRLHRPLTGIASLQACGLPLRLVCIQPLQSFSILACASAAS